MAEMRFPNVLPAGATAEEKKTFDALVKERDTLAEEAKSFHSRIRETVNRDIAEMKRQGREPTTKETQELYQTVRRSVGGNTLRKLDRLNEMIAAKMDEVEARISRGPAAGGRKKRKTRKTKKSRKTTRRRRI